MRQQHHLHWALAIATALTLSGCGKKKPDETASANAPAISKEGVAAARIQLKNAVQANPKSGEARFWLGRQLLIDGDAAAATVELQRALESKYAQGLVMPMLVEAMCLSGQAQKAIDNYGDAQLPDPGQMAHLQAMLAFALALKGDMAGARQRVDRGLAVAPLSAPALLIKARLLVDANDTVAALAVLDQLLAANPTDAEAWALKGDILLRRPSGQGPAIEAYGNALKANPNHLYSQFALTSLYLSSGDVEAARKQFATIQKLAPNQLNTALFEAHLAEADGKYGRAREIHQSLLKELPENVNLLLSAGNNELNLNAPVQAESYFAKASALAPANALARRLLAQAQIRLGQAPKALVTLAPVLDSPNVGVDVLAVAAQAQMIVGDAKAADLLYTRLAKLKPADPQLRTVVATAGFGKRQDVEVFNELRLISADDKGTSADLALINAYQKRGQLDEALQALSGLQLKRPKDPIVPMVRGQILSQKGDNAGARQSLEQSLAADPGYFPAVAALSVLDLLEQKPEDARKRFTTLLKARPNHPLGLQALAELSARLGAPKAEVLKNWQAAVKAAPVNVSVRAALVEYHLRYGELEPALIAAQAAVAALPESIELLNLQARCQLRVKQVNQALASYGKVASLAPKAPQPYLNMADAYVASNDLDAAQRSVNKALELSPNLPDALIRSAQVAQLKHLPEVAMGIARTLQAKPATLVDGLMIEGQIEFNREHWDAAAVPLRKAIQVGANSRVALLLHLALVKGGKSKDAEAMSDAWLKAHPKDTAFLFYLGDQAHRSQDPTGADRLYRQALAVDPGHVQTLNNLAMLLIEQNQPGAVPIAERALSAAQDMPTVYDTLAQAYAADKNFGKAVDIQKRAVALDPDDGALRLSLAKLYLKSGAKAQAKTELENLAALGAKFSQQDEVTQLRGSLSLVLPGR